MLPFLYMAIERMGGIEGNTADPHQERDAVSGFVSGNERLRTSLTTEFDAKLDSKGFLPGDLALIDQQKLTTIYRKLNATEGAKREMREETYNELFVLLREVVA
jgi:hypothetical protein